jgi:hypothetical protein
MRTKTLLLTAAIGVAGLSSSVAQSTNVFSVNVVGYVNLPLSTGFSLIANQLNTTNNTIGNLLQNVPNFSNFYRWNGTSFDVATYSFGAWDQPTYSLAPGEGGFFNTDTATTLTFVGEVLQGALANPIPVGFSIRSSKVPQAGGVDTLGLTNLSNFDNLYQWNPTNQSYQVFTYQFGAWDPAVPVVKVGEAVFINAQAATSWDRNFQVNP